MNIAAVVLVALGLSMDTFAVCVTSGVAARELKLPHALRSGVIFGTTQALMLFLGWLAGIGFRNLISTFDHWIAFIILTVIGIKMVYESGQIGRIEKKIDTTSVFALLFLSVATSIDALAVGFSFTVINVSVAGPVAIIGLVTFLVSAGGMYIGSKVGHFFEKKAEAIGGLILIAIGIKILLEHLR